MVLLVKYLPVHRLSTTHRSTLYSLDVIVRLLEALAEGRDMKKTSLALKTGLNYNSCMRYLHLLETLGLIAQTKGENSGPAMSITNLGRLMQSRLSFFLASSNVKEKDAESIRQLSAKMMLEKHNSNASEWAKGSSNHLIPAVSVQNQSKKDLRNDQTFSATKSTGPTVMKIAPRIMIIDDEHDILVTYQSILSHAGYGVEVFSEPEAALKRFASRESSYYDLIMMDIRMPKMNGLQLYQRVRAINPHTRVIFISSLDAARELVTLFPEIREPDIIRKPLDMAGLIHKVQGAIGISK